MAFRRFLLLTVAGLLFASCKKSETELEVVQRINNGAVQFMQRCMESNDGSNLEEAKQVCLYKMMKPLRDLRSRS